MAKKEDSKWLLKNKESDWLLKNPEVTNEPFSSTDLKEPAEISPNEEIFKLDDLNESVDKTEKEKEGQQIDAEEVKSKLKSHLAVSEDPQEDKKTINQELDFVSIPNPAESSEETTPEELTQRPIFIGQHYSFQKYIKRVWPDDEELWERPIEGHVRRWLEDINEEDEDLFDINARIQTDQIKR